MSYRFIDTHCHIHFPAYDQDRTEVLARLRSAGGAAILIGTSLANGRAAIRLAEQHPDLWATVGLHPSHVTHPDGADRLTADAPLRR
jgi:TatD DNase family protein